MSTINERIRAIIDTKYNGSQRAFADAIGTSSSVINGIVGKRQSSPSFELAQKISAIASVSPDWLLTGNGEMIMDRNEHRDRVSDLVREYSLSNVANAFGISILELGQYTNDTEWEGKKFDPVPKYQSILDAFPNVSAEWLYLGKGDMLRSERSRIPTYDNSIYNSTPEVREFSLKSKDAIIEQQSIPLYSFEAAASILSQGDVSEYILDRIHIPRMPKCDGAVIVSGDSMVPIIESGDIVLYKTFESFDSIIYGQMYLVSLILEGDTLILVKYIRKVEGDPSSVMLCSENPAHEPMKVKLANIRHIALIKGSIRYHTM